MNHYQISFIVPVYNAEKYIQRCVNSIYQQGLTAGTFEIIIINDGSKDASIAVAQKLKAEHVEIKIIDQPNQGVSVARNAGLALATGEYIWFVDVDDLLFAGAGLRLMECIRRLNLDVLTFGLKEVPNDNNLTTPVFQPLGTMPSVISGAQYIAERNYYNTVWHYLIRRGLLEENGIKFTPGRVVVDDAIITPTIFLSAQRMAHYHAPAYVYIRNDSSLTKKRDDAHVQKASESMVWVIRDFAHLLNRQEVLAGGPLLARLKSRRDSYTLFLFLRLLASSLPMAYLQRQYDEFLKQEYLPISHLSSVEYPGFKYVFAKKIINHRWLFNLTARCFRVFNFVRGLGR